MGVVRQYSLPGLARYLAKEAGRKGKNTFRNSGYIFKPCQRQALRVEVQKDVTKVARAKKQSYTKSISRFHMFPRKSVWFGYIRNTKHSIIQRSPLFPRLQRAFAKRAGSTTRCTWDQMKGILRIQGPWWAPSITTLSTQRQIRERIEWVLGSKGMYVGLPLVPEMNLWVPKQSHAIFQKVDWI